MILKGSERGGARQLALHLMNDKDNDHIEVHAVNGFMARDVEGALREIEAISRVTRCKQFMFSLSLSPPEGEIVTIEDYENAVDQAASRVGLSGQPHVILFHEKNGRRHCHAVFSRIDARQLKGINLSFYKDRLNEVAHELFLAHGWDVPDGFKNRERSDPLNYNLVAAHEAKKAGRDPKEVKAILLDCWQLSDDAKSFGAALEEKGFVLCRGDRRGFVVVDMDGKPYSLSRWLEIKPKQIRHKLGDPEHLPGVDEIQDKLAHSTIKSGLAEFHAERDAETITQLTLLAREKYRLVTRQRRERDDLKVKQERVKIERAKQRQESLRSGLSGLWDRISGKREKQIAAVRIALEDEKKRDDLERLKLSSRHLSETRKIQENINTLENRREADIQSNHPAMSRILAPSQGDTAQSHRLADHIKRNPDYLLTMMTEKESVFTRRDIAVALNKHINDPQDYQNTLAAVLASKELVLLSGAGETARYSTRSMVDLERGMMDNAMIMARRSGFGVSKTTVEKALNAHDKEAGFNLSREQRDAATAISGNGQISCVVGVAGAGKSTMLAAARNAWEAQGYRVLGAALAGKAAKGLEEASGIKSKTLASYELSWRNNLHELQKNDVLIIDEAGMIGSKQMATFINHAKDKGAKIVLIGDAEQLQPINAGSPFRAISNEIGATALGTVHRQKQDWQKQASMDFASGNTHAALQAYDENGAIHFMDSASQAEQALVYDYMQDMINHGDKHSRLALAHRRDDVKALNDMIRTHRKDMGDLSGETTYKTAHGNRSFAPGDRLLFTQNDRALGVKNGMLGTVTKNGDNHLFVQLDDSNGADKPRIVHVDLYSYDSIDHGYATTIHKSQGATVDRTFVLASYTMDRHLTYVAMTRHKHEATLYAGKDEFHSTKNFSRTLSRDGQKLSTVEIGRTVSNQIADNRHNNTLGCEIEYVNL